MRKSCVLALAALTILATAAQAQTALVLNPNMQVLTCEMPNTTYRFVGSNAPGQLFFADEPVHVKLVFKKGGDRGSVAFAIEIQEITTRDPERKVKGLEGFTDTAGHALIIGLEGKPVTHPLKVTFDDKPEVAFEVKDLPVPKKLGTYGLMLVRGGKRQFLGSVARVPRPRPAATLDNTPIFGETGFFDKPERFPLRAQQYARMGIRGMRLDAGWRESKDGTYDWSWYDSLFTAAQAARIKVMVTLGAHPPWAQPFGQPTPAAGWTPKTGGYWATGDWTCDPKLYPRYGKWITAFCQRYWKDGKGALWGLENYNEPWQGGGISGWASDIPTYRTIQKLIAESAWKVDRRIKICAASSIMNTEDNFYSAGDHEMDRYVDVFTDHYVAPPMCYGPLVARAHGKESTETETWFVNSEYLLPQVAQFLACGQKRTSPWHARVLFDTLPGSDDPYFIPSPVVVATAAFNHFVSAKAFERIVFHNHLPWVFQFGADDDKEAVLIVFGQLISFTGASAGDPRTALWAQVNNAKGGTMTIDNGDGLLRFHDLAGNPLYLGQKAVTLPMNIFPTYITCAKGPAAAAQRLKQARLEGKRPVEILPRDFTRPLAAKGSALAVAVHNCLNRPVTGKLAVQAPKGITLKSMELPVYLAAGETKVLSFEIATATPAASNAYRFGFLFTSDAGNASYQEVLNVVAVPKGAKTIDGNLDDWKDVPGITVVAGLEKADIAESIRRPWLDLKDKKPDGSFAEVKLAWDENFLYVAALVNNPTPQMDKPRLQGRDENQYFHSKASDLRTPYKEFLAKGRSFAEVPHVYCKSPYHDMPFAGDRLQIGLDVTEGWHDLAPTTDRVPYGFHAVPDTDYEYSLYLCGDGKSELWRLLAPGVPRMHDFPRQPRGQRTTGPVPGAKHVVRQDGKTRIYELAIPRQELGELALKAGTTCGFTFRIGNNKGPSIDYGLDKAVTKTNGLTLHPYWEPKPSCGVRWALVE